MIIWSVGNLELFSKLKFVFTRQNFDTRVRINSREENGEFSSVDFWFRIAENFKKINFINLLVLL